MTVHAQTERYYALTTSSSITLNSISELTSYNGAAPQIMITDSIRGGIFYKYSGKEFSVIEDEVVSA